MEQTMLAMTLPTISRFWGAFISLTAILGWLVNQGVIGGYITLMFYLTVANIPVLFRDVLRNNLRMWPFVAMVTGVICSTIMLFFGMMQAEDQLIKWVVSFF
ncbi:MAG: hypothetical protein Q7K54_03475 [Candidatus Parcubacteria bacterium]|nr:hypothetical protein [Candidatus Parcubacteria bacterium]